MSGSAIPATKKRRVDDVDDYHDTIRHHRNIIDLIKGTHGVPLLILTPIPLSLTRFAGHEQNEGLLTAERAHKGPRTVQLWSCC